MSKFLAAVLAAAMLFAVPLAAPSPAQAAGSVSVEVCVPALSSNTISCSQPVPSGAPWVLYRVRGVAPSVPITVQGNCRWTGTRRRNLWCYLTDVGAGGGWQPGEHTVRVIDTASAALLAQASFRVTPQSPAEALAAFQNGTSSYARAGVVLALARGGDLGQALRAGEAMSRAADPSAQYESFPLRVDVLLAMHRPAEAEQVARGLIPWRRAHGQAPQAYDYASLARAALAACDYGAAEQALGQASLLAPGDKSVERLLIKVEAAKAGGGACPAGTPPAGQ